MLDEARFVQVSTGPPTGKARLGSGFQLSADVVLTARHVLFPPAGSSDTSISIRGPKQDDWTPADLLWPLTRAELDQAPDVALLKVRGAPPSIAVSSRPLGLERDERSDPTLSVFAVGYPRLKTPRDTQQIDAKLRIFSGLRSDALELSELDLNGGNSGARSAAENWGGFSGAPVFAQRRIIGVVAAVEERGRYDFRATRLDLPLDDPEFVARLPAGAQHAGKAAPIELPPLDSLIYLLDRDDQELDFQEAHGRCCPTAADPVVRAARPLICILPGVAEVRHAPFAFLNRLAYKVLPALKWPNGAISFRPLPWPKRGDNAAIRVQALRSGLWRNLCGEGPAPAAAADYVALLSDPSRPRTFYSELAEAPLGDVTAEMLRLWIDFLGGIEVLDPCPPTHLLFVSAGYAETEQWLKRVEATAGLRVELLTELDMCTPLERDEWAERRLPHAQRPMLQAIRPALWREFGGNFFAQDFQLRINDLISARLNG